MRGASGAYDPATQRIAISQTNTGDGLATTIAHEVIHAVFKHQPNLSDTEHALVYAMAALYREGADKYWNFGGTNVIHTPPSDLPALETVGHAMYRIYKKVGKSTAFKFAFRVAGENPTPKSVVEDFETIAEQLGILTQVRDVLIRMGLIVVDTPAPAPTPARPPTVNLTDCEIRNDDGFGAIKAYLSVNSNGTLLGAGRLRIQGRVAGQLLADYYETISANNQNINYVTGRALNTGGGETAVSIFVSVDWSNTNPVQFGTAGDSCVIRRITQE